MFLLFLPKDRLCYPQSCARSSRFRVATDLPYTPLVMSSCSRGFRCQPTAEEFHARLDEAQAWAKSVGYQESDVDDVIKSVRAKRHA